MIRVVAILTAKPGSREDFVALFKLRKRCNTAELIELTRREECHIASNKFTECHGVVGEQLRRRVEPFLLLVAEIETGGDGVNRV